MRGRKWAFPEVGETSPETGLTPRASARRDQRLAPKIKKNKEIVQSKMENDLARSVQEEGIVDAFR
jgi:hypothetical protein